jgi:hypothetical protein
VKSLGEGKAKISYVCKALKETGAKDENPIARRERKGRSKARAVDEDNSKKNKTKGEGRKEGSTNAKSRPR